MSQFKLNVGILLMQERDLAATSADEPNSPLREELVDRMEKMVSDAEAVMHDAMFGEMPDGTIWSRRKCFRLRATPKARGILIVGSRLSARMVRRSSAASTGQKVFTLCAA